MEVFDEVRGGRVYNGFDNALRVWVKEGIIQDCFHLPLVQRFGCCDAHRLSGKSIYTVKGAEERTLEPVLAGGSPQAMYDQ